MSKYSKPIYHQSSCKGTFLFGECLLESCDLFHFSLHFSQKRDHFYMVLSALGKCPLQVLLVYFVFGGLPIAQWIQFGWKMACPLTMECVVEEVRYLYVLLSLEAKVRRQFSLSLLEYWLLQVDSILYVPHVLGHALVSYQWTFLL